MYFFEWDEGGDKFLRIKEMLICLKKSKFGKHKILLLYRRVKYNRKMVK